MSNDAPQVRERFFMSTQGERLFSITMGVVLVAFVSWLVTSCTRESNQIEKVPEVVSALSKCNEQPALSVAVYSGTPADPGRNTETKPFTDLDRDKYLVEAVSTCRKDVLDYYARLQGAVAKPGAN